MFLVIQQLKDLGLLERCLKETLRLRPPIMTMMRMARSPQVRPPPSSTKFLPHRNSDWNSFSFKSLIPPRRPLDTPSLSVTKSASPRRSTTACAMAGSRGWSSGLTATSMTTLLQGRSLPTSRLELVRGKVFLFFQNFLTIVISR